MKLSDRLMATAALPLGIFAVMFLGAIVAEICGALSREQVSLLASYSVLPLFLAALLLIPACLLPEEAHAKE